MTLMEHNLAALVKTSAAHCVQVRWTAMRHAPDHDGGAPSSFHRATAVLVVETIDDGRAMVEMWIEECGRRRVVRERLSVRARITQGNDLLQIDAEGLCRLTLRNVADESRPLFAQCSLLEKEGFRAGGFDPPMASVKMQECTR